VATFALLLSFHLFLQIRFFLLVSWFVIGFQVRLLRSRLACTKNGMGKNGILRALFYTFLSSILIRGSGFLALRRHEQIGALFGLFSSIAWASWLAWNERGKILQTLHFANYLAEAWLPEHQKQDTRYEVTKKKRRNRIFLRFSKGIFWGSVRFFWVHHCTSRSTSRYRPRWDWLWILITAEDGIWALID